MTRAFCRLVLHYSVARLSWKTIKSLRRPRARRTNDATKHDDDNDVVTPVEFEILQGWTVLAFHHLYVSCGIEYVVTCFVPFYFHFKMMALIATFAVPSRPYKFGGGMSPVVSYLFDYLIVPGVQRVHTLLGNDPRGWARHQLAMLPFLLLDWLVFPGLLTSEDGKRQARERLRNGDGGGDSVMVPPPIAFPVFLPGRSSDDGMISSDDDRSLSPMENEDERRPPLLATEGGDADAPRNELVRRDSLLANDNRNQNADDDAGRLDARKIDEGGGGVMIRGTMTPPRGAGSTHLDGGSRVPALPPTTTPNEERSSSSPAEIFSSRKRFESIILTPLVRRRLASTASKLKRFSPDCRGGSNGGLPSLSKSPLGRREGSRDDRGVNGDGDGNDDASRTKIARSSIVGLPVGAADGPGGTLQTSTRQRRGDGGRRRERLSLGDHFRELVTGDANVRVRDHLFDLDLPSTPERRKGSGGSRGGGGREGGRSSRQVDPDEWEGINALNVTTRRSTRIAKGKVS
jgi:hypothetical protein